MAAIEFAFNLEVLKFSDVLLMQGVSEADYERYFIGLSDFLSHSKYRFSDVSFFHRAISAHKLMSDSFENKQNVQLKIIEDCFEWLMPFPILMAPSK
jgi:hypothetical protein